MKVSTNDTIDYSTDENISDTAQIENSLPRENDDEERNKTLKSLSKKRFAKENEKLKKENQPMKKNAKRPALNVEDDY